MNYVWFISVFSLTLLFDASAIYEPCSIDGTQQCVDPYVCISTEWGADCWAGEDDDEWKMSGLWDCKDCDRNEQYCPWNGEIAECKDFETQSVFIGPDLRSVKMSRPRWFVDGGLILFLAGLIFGCCITVWILFIISKCAQIQLFERGKHKVVSVNGNETDSPL
eukprot:UN13436